MSGELMVDEHITHSVTLDQINGAFDYMKAGTALRAIVNLPDKA